MKLSKILGLNVKLKNDKSKFSPPTAVKWEEKVFKCDKHEYERHGMSPINGLSCEHEITLKHV